MLRHHPDFFKAVVQLLNFVILPYICWVGYFNMLFVIGSSSVTCCPDMISLNEKSFSQTGRCSEECVCTQHSLKLDSKPGTDHRNPSVYPFSLLLIQVRDMAGWSPFQSLDIREGTPVYLRACRKPIMWSFILLVKHRFSYETICKQTNCKSKNNDIILPAISNQFWSLDVTLQSRMHGRQASRRNTTWWVMPLKTKQ